MRLLYHAASRILCFKSRPGEEALPRLTGALVLYLRRNVDFAYRVEETLRAKFLVPAVLFFMVRETKGSVRKVMLSYLGSFRWEELIFEDLNHFF